jgi:5-methyltetrahydrofolate--homocysteine methyltransferase
VNVTLQPLDYKEALRYMGMGQAEPAPLILDKMKQCEEAILQHAKAAFTYKVFPTEVLKLPGSDAAEHVKGCSHTILLCATIGAAMDRLIRQAELTDMSDALILDTMASVAVEQVCEQAEQYIHGQMPKQYMTWRFGVGYGDFPLSYQSTFLRLTDAGRQLGVTLTDSNILIPRKTVTCCIGLSSEPVSKGKRGCGSCNLRNQCMFRKRGERCVS